MIFEWPWMLWALLIVPALATVYHVLQKRKRQAALQYARWAAGEVLAASRFKRNLPPILYLLALTLLIGAMARPVAVLTLPSFRDVVILAIDVSNSMLADDLEPNRLAAAQKAAREFIEEQPSTTQIGIVAFAETALTIQRPTLNREDLLKAVDRLKPQEGTAVGGAILTGLQTLFPKETFELQRKQDNAQDNELGRPLPEKAQPTPEKQPVEPGPETSAAIILLTDGQATGGPDPLKAAQLAADRGVRVFTVGIGTEPGAVVKFKGVSMRTKLDEETLKKIADVTLARYFLANNAEDLREVYRELNMRLVSVTRETEVSAIFVAVAAAAAFLAAAMSVTWFNRIL
ncbi:MAG: VWA domain-containing protein [Rhodospirillaceae bacterium]|nr:VWA domain-containing protein [Rhodospirillaceae bacterium]